MSINRDSLGDRMTAVRRTFRRACLTMAVVLGLLWAAGAVADEKAPPPPEPWLAKRLEEFKDLKFGFMMHFGPYSQWGCIESWPLVEEDTWARPDDLKPWIERNKDLPRFQRDYRRWGRPSIPRSSTRARGRKPPSMRA